MYHTSRLSVMYITIARIRKRNEKSKKKVLPIFLQIFKDFLNLIMAPKFQCFFKLWANYKPCQSPVLSSPNLQWCLLSNALYPFFVNTPLLEKICIFKSQVCESRRAISTCWKGPSILAWCSSFVGLYYTQGHRELILCFTLTLIHGYKKTY